MEYMVWVWLAVFIITLVAEAFTFDLVSIWFSFAAIVALIVAVTTDLAYYYQIVIFICVSVVLLLLTRPLMKKLLKNQERKTNADSFIGKQVIVSSPISKYEAGTIKMNDVIYTAILPLDTDATINEGEVVEIIALNGNKVVVRKIVKRNEGK